MIHKNKKILFSLFAVLIVSILAYLVWAADPDPGVDAIVAVGSSGVSLLDPSGTGLKNISGTAFNFTILLNHTTDDENYLNVTVMFISRSNFSTMFNTTIGNFSGVGCSGAQLGAGPGWNCTNRTYFNFSLNTVSIPDGIYNISYFIFNGTGVTLSGAITNVTASVNITIDNKAPNITYLRVNVTNSSGYTTNFTRGGVIRINATVNDSTTYVRNVTFGIRTIDRALSNTTEFNITTNRTDWVWFTDVPLSTFSDGLYQVVVYVNDTLNNFNGSNANFTAFVVDQTPPNVSALIVGNLTNGINLSKNLTNALANYLVPINVSVNDTTTYVETVIINVSNATGLVYQFNGSRNNTKWNSSSLLNLSLLGDGQYHITIYANDTLKNRNNSVNFTFRIDRGPPTVTVSCGGPYTEGQTVTCTCTATDTGGSLVQTGPRFSNGQSTETTTATGTSGTSSGCEAIDYAGNVRTAITSTWTVTAASSGGSGSGGSGGGSSSGVTDQFEKKVWTSINVGETASVQVKNGAIGVSEVSFAVSKTTYGAWVQVKKVDSLPSTVKSFDQEAYSTIEISQQNVEKVLVGEATVKFKVAKSWLTEKSLSNNDVALYHYAGGSWVALPTTMGENDGTYVHYSATTPSFSYFVIGEAVTAAAVIEETAPAEEVAAEAPVEEAAAEAPVAVASAKSNALVWIVPLVVLLLVAGLLYWYWQRR